MNNTDPTPAEIMSLIDGDPWHLAHRADDSEPDGIDPSFRWVVGAAVVIMSAYAAGMIMLADPSAPVFAIDWLRPFTFVSEVWAAVVNAGHGLVDAAYHAIGSPFGPLCDTDSSCLAVHGHGM